MDERRRRLSGFIKELRGDISLRELARRLDVSVGTVEAWEKGRSLPDLDNLYRLASYAGMTPDSLLLFLDNGHCPDLLNADQIAGRIRVMDGPDVAVIARALIDRLAAS